MRQSLDSSHDTPPTTVLMLEGGIHNYLEWIKQEGLAKDSLWLGKNYVFDARQSLGLEDTTTTAVARGGVAEEVRLISHCQECNVSCARYVKCDGFGCHRLIIACATCSPIVAGNGSGIHCCGECQEMGERVRQYTLSGQESCRGAIRVKRGICDCELKRRAALFQSINT